MGALLTFEEVLDDRNYECVPQDWSVVVVDVCGSTQAIERGEYKNVNAVGAASIIGVLNSVGELPYIFGGDGATFLCPPEKLRDTARSLKRTQEIAASSFSLDLRVGIVKVAELTAQGAPVLVAHYELSHFFKMAALSGSGIALAEELVKCSQRGENFALKSKQKGKGHYQGFECRWNPVPSKRGSMMSLVVRSNAQTPEKASQHYKALLQKLNKLFPEGYKPLSKDRLSLASHPSAYRQEFQLRTFGKTPFARLAYHAGNYSITQAAKLLWNSALKKSGDNYKDELVLNTDYRKFDGTLRMLIDGTVEHCNELEAFLEESYQKGELIFGSFRSKEALLTCLIFDRAKGRHLHFIDGNDGGYALAAKAFKERLANEVLSSTILAT